MRSPRSLAILLALLCGVAVSHSQSPSYQAFLTERFAVKTHSGVTGLPTGTALHVVSQNGNTFRVTAAGSTLPFDVPKDKLTTDANLAARLVQNEYAAQQAAVQLSAQPMEADRQAQAAKRAEQERQAAAQRQAEIQRQQQAAQWQAEQQRRPEIPSALQVVQAIQAEQGRQAELHQAEQQRQGDIAQAQLAAQAQHRQRQIEVEQLDSTWAHDRNAILNNWQNYRDRVQDSEHGNEMLQAHSEKEFRELERQAVLPARRDRQ